MWRAHVFTYCSLLFTFCQLVSDPNRLKSFSSNKGPLNQSATKVSNHCARKRQGELTVTLPKLSTARGALRPNQADLSKSWGKTGEKELLKCYEYYEYYE